MGKTIHTVIFPLLRLWLVGGMDTNIEAQWPWRSHLDKFLHAPRDMPSFRGLSWGLLSILPQIPFKFLIWCLAWCRHSVNIFWIYKQMLLELFMMARFLFAFFFIIVFHASMPVMTWEADLWFPGLLWFWIINGYAPMAKSSLRSSFVPGTGELCQWQGHRQRAGAHTIHQRALPLLLKWSLHRYEPWSLLRGAQGLHVMVERWLGVAAPPHHL